MQIQRGLVKYKDRSDIICTYGVTGDGKQYYFLNDGKLDNGNFIVTTTLLEAVDPLASATHVGLIDANGNVLIPCENKSIKVIGKDMLLVELAKPFTESVLQSIRMKDDPLSATKLVTTPATIKDKMIARMGENGHFVLNDQFSEATICNLNGQNLINNEYYSFIALTDKRLYLSKNTVDSEIMEYNLYPEEKEEEDSKEVDENSSVYEEKTEYTEEEKVEESKELEDSKEENKEEKSTVSDDKGEVVDTNEENEDKTNVEEEKEEPEEEENQVYSEDDENITKDIDSIIGSTQNLEKNEEVGIDEEGLLGTSFADKEIEKDHVITTNVDNHYYDFDKAQKTTDQYDDYDYGFDTDTNYYNDYDYSSPTVDVPSRNFMDDVTKTISNLVELNRNLQAMVDDYDRKLAKCNASRQKMMEVTKQQAREISSLNAKIARLEADKQILENKLAALSPSSQGDLARVLADAQTVLGNSYKRVRRNSNNY